MDNKSRLDNKINSYIDSFNIILADKDLETFERIRKLNNKFNFINLSSDFAVNFILEYEKIDLIIISKKISSLSNIIEKANRKKISVYILGRDIKCFLQIKIPHFCKTFPPGTGGEFFCQLNQRAA